MMISHGCIKAKMFRRNPKLPIGRVSEFRDMNEFSGISIVSLEFRVSPGVDVIV